MSFGSCALKMLLICVLCSSGSTSTCPKAKVKGTFIKNGKTMVRGVEGKTLTIVCNVQSDKPTEKFVLRIEGLKLKRDGSGNLTYSFIPSKSDNMKSFGCSVYNAFLLNPQFCEVLFDIQYSPLVKIIKEVTEKKLKLICNPNGNPENYTFADWEHWSEFNEHIRNVQGTPDGTLTFLESNNNNRLHENDGIYKCRTSNGIYDTNGDLYQNETAIIIHRVPPVFVNANKPVQFGRYGQRMNLTVLLYNKYGTIQTTISKQNETLHTHGRQETIQTHDIFHDVNVTVSGIKITYLLTVDTIEDFTDYTIKACNGNGCNELTVKIQLTYRLEPPTNVSVVFLEGNLKVSWYPGYNGGLPQKCFLEYQSEYEELWRRSGPVIDKKEKGMSKILYDIIPNTRYHVRVLAINEIGQSNTTEVITLDRPDPPTNVSIVPFEGYLKVSWCPGYNGGFPQTFFVEYKSEGQDMWKRSGPVIDNMEIRMSKTLNIITPNTRNNVRVLSKNEIGESNTTTVITLDHPETPKNVSVVPFKGYLEVSWCPGYNGGFQQTFFVEYQTEDQDMWKRSGPVIDNMEIRMSKTLYNITPNTRNYIRVLSKNEIGESNTTTVITLDHPEPPTNVSVIPFKSDLAVSWCPGYNGGFPQTFFVEYQSEDQGMWSRSRPIIDNMELRMSKVLFNIIPSTRFNVRVLSKNEIGESNTTTVITLDCPEPSTNVSVIPFESHLVVSWCPGYNGGFPQTFFVEYQSENDEMWKCSGPVIDNMESKMSKIVYDITPKTRYHVRVMSKNEIGESSSTNVITSGLSNNIYDVTAILFVLLVVIAVALVKAVLVVVLIVLAVVLAIAVLTAFFCLRRKANKESGIYNPREEEVRENFQMEPVDNQLYLSSDDPDLAHVHNLRNQSVTNTSLPSTSRDNQTYQMQLNNENGANVRRPCTYINRGVVSSVNNRQICETSLNYTEITFNEAPTMHDAAIHGTCGSVNRTIYSEIDLMADPVAPLSSSESECDESDESDILSMHM